MQQSNNTDFSGMQRESVLSIPCSFSGVYRDFEEYGEEVCTEMIRSLQFSDQLL